MQDFPIVTFATRRRIVEMYASPDHSIKEIAATHGVSSAMVNKVVNMDAPHLRGTRKRGVGRRADYDKVRRDVASGFTVSMAAQRHGICRETASRIVNA
jgi:transposase-like protein